LAQYYYLVSSLPELASDILFERHPYPAFEEFAREELHPDDYSDMRKCFLMNDASNISSKLDKLPLAMKTPSFYTENELELGLAEPDEFFDFFSELIWDVRLEKQITMPRQNELLWRMMRELAVEEESVIKGFPREYLIFRMQLKNLATALACRKDERPYANEILPFDHFSSKIGMSQAPDFGIGDELGVMKPLIDAFADFPTLDIEREITRISWAWLDEQIGYRHFSRESVFSFAIRIADVERWLAITPADGRQMLDELLRSLHQGIESARKYSL